MESLLVSGDEAERVQVLGHPHARASMQPLEKLELVRSLRAQGRRVLFIGDKINDAAAMAESHAALAVESGADLARDTAHGVLRAEAVVRAPELIAIARAARRLARDEPRLGRRVQSAGHSGGGGGPAASRVRCAGDDRLQLDGGLARGGVSVA
jgi:hypothetical protein